MYLFMTPGIFQLARMQIEAIGGDEVIPLAMCVAAPLRMECVPKLLGLKPRSMNDCLYSGECTILRKISL